MSLDCMHDRIQKLSENVMLSTKQTRGMQEELKQLHKIYKQVEIDSVSEFFPVIDGLKIRDVTIGCCTE